MAIEVLVEAADPRGDAVTEAQSPRDFRTARAARLDQLVGDLDAVAQDVRDAAQPAGKTGIQAGVTEHEAEHVGQSVAHGLVVAPEGEIVGQVELADARGVAAAAEVLEQQRVVEIAQGGDIQADRLADVHADPAHADAVAFRLTFGQVERMAERAHELREPHCRQRRRR